MNFDNVILTNQMPIITLYNCTIEYEHEYFHFNITMPFSEEIYNKVQKVPYILYLPEENKTLTVTYYTGIEIEQSAYAETYITIQGVEGAVQDLGVLSVSKNDLNYLTVTDDPVPYSFNYNYEKELLSNADELKPWGQGKEKDDKTNTIIKNSAEGVKYIDRIERITATRDFVVPSDNQNNISASASTKTIYIDPKTMEPYPDIFLIKEGESYYKFTRSLIDGNKPTKSTTKINDNEDKWEIDWEQSFIDETEQQFIEW